MKETSLEAQRYQRALKHSCSLLKEIGQSADPETILKAEKATLLQELSTYANSSEMKNSLSPALEQLQGASDTLELVQDHEAYAKAAITYSAKRKQGGLPLDAFREFVKSHTARLTNRLKATSSVPEKNLLRQRKENLKVANLKYMELQRAALGIEAEKGREM